MKKNDIDEALDESFPASDPPSWMPGEAGSGNHNPSPREKAEPAQTPFSMWLLSPVVRQDDPHWKDYDYKEAVMVKAANAADARQKATKWYKENFQTPPDRPLRQFYRSAFDDEKLYRARPLSESAAKGMKNVTKLL